jgi:hypothetical protein
MIADVAGSSRGFRRAVAVLVLVLLSVSAGWGCSVPVFRYALERWAPSTYELWIFHRGPLGASEAQLASELEALVSGGGLPANVEVQWVDVGGAMSPAAARAWSGQQPVAMPHATLVFAPHGSATGVAHAGPATLAGLRQLLVSPMRQQVVDRLLGGDSAIWLLVESGDAVADDVAFKRLTGALAEAERDLRLPEPDADSSDVTLAESDTPLRISFPVLRLSRREAEEAGFIALLTSTFTPAPRADQPFTVVVTGQGRAIAMLAGDDIDANYINAWCAFIAGACSCEVKADLPGSDLLLKADWSRLSDGRRVQEPEVPNVAALSDVVAPVSGPTAPVPGGPTAPATRPEAPEAAEPAGLLWHLVRWAAVALACLVGLSAWRLLRRREG